MAYAPRSVMDFMVREKIVYINVANRLSVDCDCDAHPQDPEMADIGIFASADPVAVDQASVDAVYGSEDAGKRALIERMESRHGIHTAEAAQAHGRTVLRTKAQTSAFMSALIGSLYNYLAPRITRSGVMMEIYGEGVLIQGESGVGKSEVAIELIKRGHRIIADDAVEIKETNHGTLVASAPELIRHYMELRGIGVIDVRRLFGMGAIKMNQEIDMVIKLEPWDDTAVYDRLGLENTYTEILGVQLPALTIPVKPGRNLASIVEVAAMNNRNRKMGHNAALELTRRMDQHFARKMGVGDE